jgi:hypothetical protein
MNVKHLIATVFIFSAVSAAHADQLAEGPTAAAKSRAQVVEQASVQATKSRADVRAELILAQDKIKASRGQRGG